MQHHDGYKVKNSRIRQKLDIRIGLTMNIHLKKKILFNMTLTKMMTLLTQTTYTEPTKHNQFSVPLIHMFTWSWSGLWQDISSHVMTDSALLCIFMLFCFELVQLLLEETNWYYHQCLLTLEEGQWQLPDMTVQEIYLFFCADGAQT